MYHHKYTVEEQHQHDRFCKSCPILEYAREHNNDWDFKKCSALECHKLSDEQFLQNKKKFGKEFKRRNHPDWEIDDLAKLELNLKSITYLVSLGWEQKEIAREYGCSQATMCAFLRKHKISTRFSWMEMLKNIPRKHKFSPFGERRKKHRFSLNGNIGNNIITV